MSSQKIKVTIPQKLILILLGVVLSLVILEIGLRLAGSLILYLQERANLLSLREKGQYVILCLGESTTADGGKNSYPRQLEKILNEKIPGLKFTVINKGLWGSRSITILSRLRKNLERYDPDLVITMMGINDGPGTMVYEDKIDSRFKVVMKKLRVYKLAELLSEHIHHTLREIGKPETRKDENDDIEITKISGRSDNSEKTEEWLKKAIQKHPADFNPHIQLAEFYLTEGNPAAAEKCLIRAGRTTSPDPEKFIRLAHFYRQKLGNLARAEEMYLKTIEIDPDREKAYLETEGRSGLAFIYIDQGRDRQAEDALKRVIEINPRNPIAYAELGRLYDRHGRTSDAVPMYEKAFQLDPANNTAIDRLVFHYRRQGRFQELEKTCRKMISNDSHPDKAYAALALSYESQGKKQLAEKCLEKAEELRTKFYNPTLARNYRKLREIVSEKGIPLVCVQYPIRKVENLRRIFPHPEGIIFVDNEKTFQQALRHGSYEEIFKDQFAGDFGHCTTFGYRLLAENIARVLSARIFGRESPPADSLPVKQTSPTLR